MVDTRSTPSKGNPTTPTALKAKASKVSKGKANEIEVSPPLLEQRMDGTRYWAKALMGAIEDRINALAEFMEEVIGQVGDLNKRIKTLTSNDISQTTTPIRGATATNGIVITSGSRARDGVMEGRVDPTL